MLKNQKDFWAGILFMGFGGFFCLYSCFNYSLGTAAHMGPGYFPAALGGFLFVLGLIVAVKGICVVPEDPASGKFGSFDWLSFFIILGSVTFFAATLRSLGLVISMAGMIFISTLANRRFRLKESLILSAVISFMVWAIFVLGLNLMVPVWPAFF